MEIIRKDFYVENEAGAVLVLPENLIGKREVEALLHGSTEDHHRGYEQGLFIHLSTYQDDSFNARLVVGELDEQEKAEWVVRTIWKLNLSCGKLAVGQTGEIDDDYFRYDN